MDNPDYGFQWFFEKLNVAIQCIVNVLLISDKYTQLMRGFGDVVCTSCSDNRHYRRVPIYEQRRTYVLCYLGNNKVYISSVVNSLTITFSPFLEVSHNNSHSLSFPKIIPIVQLIVILVKN